jgi:pentose-5-phosphate-3-epimerase
MVTHPRHYIDSLAKAGANCFTFHYEVEDQDLDQVEIYLYSFVRLFVREKCMWD